MKKILALVMSALLLLGLFVGCGKVESDGGKGAAAATEGDDIPTADKAGSLVVTANASLNIVYNAEGLVLKVEGLNQEGENLMDSFDELLGASCGEAVNTIIKECSVKTYDGRLTYVLVKYEKDAGIPEGMKESVESGAKEAVEKVAPDAKLAIVTPDMLDENGYINLETAQLLVEGYLEVEKLDGFYGTETPVDGFYSFKVVFGGMEDEVHVNASNGIVGDGALSPTEEEEVEEETEPVESTPAESEPVVDEPVAEEPEQTEATEAPVE